MKKPPIPKAHRFKFSIPVEVEIFVDRETDEDELEAMGEQLDGEYGGYRWSAEVVSPFGWYFSNQGCYFDTAACALEDAKEAVQRNITQHIGIM